MTNKLRIITFTVLVVLLAFVAVSYIATKNSTAPTPTTQSTNQQIKEQKNAKIAIEFPANEKIEVDYVFDNEKTAYDALDDIANENNIAIDTEQYDFGVFIKSIRGYESTAEMSWIYFVNNESANVGADQYLLKDGDVIQWRYVEPEY